MSKAERVDALLAAAKQHGEDSEPDHEVGDLQDCLRYAVAMFTDEQFEHFFGSDPVKDTLEAGGAE